MALHDVYSISLIRMYMYTLCSVTCTVVAKAVLDRCMETNADSEEDPSKVWLEFNYEFLEDKTGRKIETHPLAQMVSYF